MNKQMLTIIDKRALDLPADIGAVTSGGGSATKRLGLAAGLVGLALFASACSGPLRQQAPVYSEPVDAAAQGKRISDDGAGGLRLPDGSRVAVDQTGGFELPNGQYVRRDRSGTLILPNGARCVADRQGGFLCP